MTDFQRALMQTNDELHDALAGLDSLQQEIDTFIATESFRNTSRCMKLQANKRRSMSSPHTSSPESATSDKTQDSGVDSLESSVAYIQTLITDTHKKCGQMARTNRKLASKLDDNFENYAASMNHLRQELDYAKRCVTDIEESMTSNVNERPECEQVELNERQKMEETLMAMRDENLRLKRRLCDLEMHNQLTIESRISAQESPQKHDMSASEHFVPSLPIDADDDKECIIGVLRRREMELHEANAQIKGLRSERRRLKSEKCDLLTQMRDVYSVLEGKEREFRDYLLGYERRIKDGDDRLIRLQKEQEALIHHNDELKACCDDANQRIKRLNDILVERDRENANLRAQLHQYNVAMSQSTHSYNMPSIQVQMRDKSKKHIQNKLLASEKRSSSASRLSRIFGNAFARASKRQTSATRANETRERDYITSIVGANLNGWPSDSVKSTIDDDNIGDKQMTIDSKNSSCTPTTIDEKRKIDLLNEAARACLRLAITEWRSVHIEAFVVKMLDLPPRHQRLFVDNVKSGPVLAQLTDHELTHTLQLSHPMLLKKVRLAIDEMNTLIHKRQYAKIGDVTASYVRDQLLPSCGLDAYASGFYAVRCDGRLLLSLNRKQLEKHFNMSKKSHQNSLIRGVELLKKFNFDLKALSARRAACERHHADLLVWTAAKFQRWLKEIDLAQCVQAAIDYALHGASITLDATITVNTLSTIMGINNRPMLKKHLAMQFNPLVFDARSYLEHRPPAQVDEDSSSDTDQTLSTLAKFTGANQTQLHRSQSPGALVLQMTGSHSNQHSMTPVSFQRVPLTMNKESPKKSNVLRTSIGKVFGRKNSRETAREVSTSGWQQPLSVRSVHSTNINQLIISNDDSKNAPYHSAQSASSANGKSSATNQQSTPSTMSSTTSDLGSSIERHMRVVCANAQYNNTQDLHTSADSAISTGDHSAGRGLTPPKCNMGITVKMRSRSAHARTSRPHSVADFTTANTQLQQLTSNGCRSSTLFDEYDWIDAQNSNCESAGANYSIGPISEEQAENHYEFINTYQRDTTSTDCTNNNRYREEPIYQEPSEIIVRDNFKSHSTHATPLHKQSICETDL